MLIIGLQKMSAFFRPKVFKTMNGQPAKCFKIINCVLIEHNRICYSCPFVLEERMAESPEK
jgi:hypothetical protein